MPSTSHCILGSSSNRQRKKRALPTTLVGGFLRYLMQSILVGKRSACLPPNPQLNLGVVMGLGGIDCFFARG